MRVGPPGHVYPRGVVLLGVRPRSGGRPNTREKFRAPSPHPPRAPGHDGPRARPGPRLGRCRPARPDRSTGRRRGDERGAEAVVQGPGGADLQHRDRRPAVPPRHLGPAAADDPAHLAQGPDQDHDLELHECRGGRRAHPAGPEGHDRAGAHRRQQQRRGHRQPVVPPAEEGPEGHQRQEREGRHQVLRADVQGVVPGQERCRALQDVPLRQGRSLAS